MGKMWKIIGSLLISVMLPACSAIPTTYGAHSSLPGGGTVAVLWGNHPAVIDTMSIWLHKQGLIVLKRDQLKQVLQSQGVILADTAYDEALIIKSAKKMNADLVVFGNLNQEIRAPMVSVRGFNLEANHVTWAGSAHYDHYIQIPLNHALVVLTCQALATAWGLREGGKNWFESPEKMCLVDSNAKQNARIE